MHLVEEPLAESQAGFDAASFGIQCSRPDPKVIDRAIDRLNFEYLNGRSICSQPSQKWSLSRPQIATTEVAAQPILQATPRYSDIPDFAVIPQSDAIDGVAHAASP